MKLRIKGNTLRLRLTQSEIVRLGETGCVSETIEFGVNPEQRLIYRLESSHEAEAITARFAGNQIIVTLPLAKAREWIETELIGLSDEQEIATGYDGRESAMGNESGNQSKQLKLLIEKDFVCIDNDSTGDQSDAFPNPNLKC